MISRSPCFLFAVLTARVTICHASNGQQAQATTGLTQYTFGTPSGDKIEIFIEVDRARANPRR